MANIKEVYGDEYYRKTRGNLPQYTNVPFSSSFVYGPRHQDMFGPVPPAVSPANANQNAIEGFEAGYGSLPVFKDQNATRELGSGGNNVPYPYYDQPDNPRTVRPNHKVAIAGKTLSNQLLSPQERSGISMESNIYPMDQQQQGSPYYKFGGMEQPLHPYLQRIERNRQVGYNPYYDVPNPQSSYPLKSDCNSIMNHLNHCPSCANLSKQVMEGFNGNRNGGGGRLENSIEILTFIAAGILLILVLDAFVRIGQNRK